MKRAILNVVAGATIVAAGAMGALAQDKPSGLTFITAGQGGSWYSMGGGMARMLSEAGIETTSEIGAGGVGNVPLISQGRGDLGFTTTIVPPMARDAVEPFTAPITNVQALMRLSQNILHISVRDDAGITDIAGLAGQSYASQKVGNVSTEAFKSALAAVGLTEDDLELTRGSQGFGATETKDRRVVGFTATTNPPSPAMSEVTQTMDVSFLSISDDVFSQMAETNAGYVRAVIPANTYRNQDEDIQTVGTDLIIIVNEDMSENDAYWLTRTFVENLEALGSIHGSLSELTAEHMAGVTGADLHPGARRYFEEIGVL
ncbi:TAXI family TRAP transporter solute-binding subunit [Roseibium algae]|uniref:TAXI family TRAP transporter solute-binding subunit n=1 Tax=Roseibium algae TaxID=3123038 RepID=A0ABU8TQV5_9HYPH